MCNVTTIRMYFYENGSRNRFGIPTPDRMEEIHRYSNSLAF